MNVMTQDFAIQDFADLAEIDRFEQAIQTFQEGGIDAERFTAVRLQQGVYGQRQPDVYMLRIKIPGGHLTAAQLEALGDIAGTYSSHGVAQATTRQSMQIHYIQLADMPAAMRRLAEVGMTSREACGNAVRNMTACPLAGVCPREHVDVATHVQGATMHFLRNPLNQQLPRKFKISFSGCEADCAQAMLHDCGVVATIKDGQRGFRVRAGGGLGHKPRESILLEEFIPEHELLFTLEALVVLHNKYSDRTRRAKSRTKFLVERFGEQGFIEKYREEFERTKLALSNRPYPAGAWRVAAESEVPGQGAPRKLFAQHQAGLFVFPITLVNGDITAAQLEGLAALLRSHGLNEVHSTQDQNLSIFNVPQAAVTGLRAGLAALGLHEPVAGDSVVACPGTATCRLGITSSTLIAPKLSGGAGDLRLRVSGCHNGCAQPETGDIGIYGEGKRLHGKLVPHYQMYLGGSGTAGGALAQKGPSVPAARIETAIARVSDAHAASGEASFFSWARAQQPDYFTDLLADLVTVTQDELPSVMRDHGDTADFAVVNLGGGECAGASQVQIGANFYEAAHEREYRNALVFQRKYGEAAQSNEAILRLLGSGLAQLLGGVRQDDLTQLAMQLQLLAAGELAEQFRQVIGKLVELAEVGVDELTAISTAVDEWTVKAAQFATTRDAQLDLSETTAGLLV